MRHLFHGLLFFICLGLVPEAKAQAPEPVPGNSSYLLLDKGLQYRITKSINSMYNFDFATAERDFAVIMYQPIGCFVHGSTSLDIVNKAGLAT